MNLNEWRDSALRDDRREHVNSKGKIYEITLQKTCMKCHSNKDRFCDVCHIYAGVKPCCWNCYFVKKGGKG